MSVVGAVAERSDRPAYVRFENRVIEDKQASLKQGQFIGKNVHFAKITPPYSKDCMDIKVDQWKMNLEADVREGRIPKEWVDNYLAQYEAWKSGQELPPVGTAIRGWGVISPAMQETLIRMNILTVEDLGAVNDEGIRRIGMGSLDLKNKAVAWLQQMKDKGPLTMEVSALKNENDSLRTQVANLSAQVEKLIGMVGKEQPAVVEVSGNSISADDILPESEPVKRKK